MLGAYGDRCAVAVLRVGILMLFVGRAWSDPGILDHIDVHCAKGQSEIEVSFQIPVRVLNYLANRTGTEVRISVLPIVTPGVEEELIGRREVRSWRPTHAVPLQEVVFTGRRIGESSLQLIFMAPVRLTEVTQGQGMSSIRIFLSNEPQDDQMSN